MNQSRDKLEILTATSMCDEMLSLILLYKSHLFSVAEEYGLTHVQVHTLRVISEGQTAMGKVAKVMHCDASNITGIIDRLIALELVTRQEDENDRRIKTIRLTTQGEKTLQQIMDQLPKRVGWEVLSEAELKELHRLLRKLTKPQ